MKKTLYLKDIVISMIQSVDLINYLLKDHHRKVAVIAYAIASKMGLSEAQIKRTVIAASLHDIGALYIEERDELVILDTIMPIDHAVRGSKLIEDLDFFVPISDVILHHHRYWQNGEGATFEGELVPIESFVIHLADRIEILYKDEEMFFMQTETIKEEILKRKNVIFEPRCVEAFVSLCETESFWLNIKEASLTKLLSTVLSSDDQIPLTEDVMRKLTKVFSTFVDFRSKFTAAHSSGVGMVAFELGKVLDLEYCRCEKLRLAGYLHDIGKLGVPTELIDKPGSLSENEKKIMRSHAYYTNLILSNIEGMDEICKWASMHHERHDGTGYPFHKVGNDFCIETDIIALADVFTALSEDRPYRQGFLLEDVLRIMTEEYSHYFEGNLLELLFENIEHLNNVRIEAQILARKKYDASLISVQRYANHPEMVQPCFTKMMEA